MTVYAVTVTYGHDLRTEDFDALRVIRRTLLGLMDHGVVTEVSTHTDDQTATWSYRPGSEDPAQVMLGLLDTVHAIAPEGWEVTQRDTW
jgi:hypothetical protein